MKHLIQLKQKILSTIFVLVITMRIMDKAIER